MKKINDAQWCAQDLIQSAFLIHAGSQSNFFTAPEQEEFRVLRHELKVLNKKAIDIISKKPDTALVVDTAMEDLEVILSKELDDVLFDIGLDAQDLMDEIVKDIAKGNLDDL